MNPGFATHLQDAFRRFGPVDVRRMFGGLGVYREGLMFALVVDEVLYLKADEAMAAALAALGRNPFEYMRAGRRVTIGSFWQAPDEVLEDAQAAAEWGRRAYDAALRAAASKSRRRPAARTREAN